MNDYISHDEVEKRLKGLQDPWLSVAFAARMAAYALPSLAARDRGKSFLWFWHKEKRQKHMLTVLRAWQCAWCAARFKDTKIAAATPTDAAVNAASDAEAFNAATNAFNVATNTATDDDIKTFAASNNATTFAAAATISSINFTATATTNAANAAFNAAAAKSAAAFYLICPDVPELVLTFFKAAYHDTLLYIKDYIQILEKNQNITPFLHRPFPSVIYHKSKLFIKSLRKWKTQGFDYWADWYEARLWGEPLDKDIAMASCLLSDEILAGSPAEINSYLKSLQNKSTNISLNRVRVIFIGYGASGKTSLIRALHGETVVEGKEEMTPGIDIREWPVPDAEGSSKTGAPENKLTAHLWDFGGQVIAHATHQFFLRSRCLYVLVMDGRSEIKADEQAEYWLEHVRAFGDNAPVMIVGNKADQQVRLNLDMRYLSEKYKKNKKNIVGFYPLSCTRYKDDFRPEFERFHRDFIIQLHSLAKNEQIKFTQSHFAVLEELKKASAQKTFLPREDYEEICRKHGIQETGELDQEWLLTLLDRLGVVIHFPDLPCLNGHLLNPRWLTYGVYHLLYSGKAQQQNGDLTDQMIVEILCDGEFKDNLGNDLCYTREQCGFIMDVLEEFEIGFRIEQHRFLIPALMPSDTPEHGFDKKDALAFDFDFSGFLPRHLIPGFIVKCHHDIDRNVDNDRNSVWQKGVLLRSRVMDATALAQADYHERRLSLWVRGSDASRYFWVLREKIIVMLERMKDLQYKEWVHLPGEPQSRRAGYLHLLSLEKAGEEEYICEYGTFLLSEVLKIIPPAQRRQEIINYNIGKVEINNADKLIRGDSMGDIVDIHDNHNAVFNNKSRLKDVQQNIQNLPAEPSEKAELKELIAQLYTELEKVPEEKADDVEIITEDTERLIKEIGKPTPNSKRLQITGEGLIEAAEALTTVAPKALNLVDRIVKMVAHFGG